MKNSLNPTRTRNAVLRLSLPALLAVVAAIGCGPQTAPAPQPVPGPQATPGSQPSPGPQVSPWPGTPAPQAAPASAGGLVGQWQTVLGGNPLTLTIEANGQYMQMGQDETGLKTQTSQGGPYQLTPPNTIHFTVTDWAPKTRWNFVPNPRCGVPGVTNPTNPKRDSCHQWQEWTEPQPPGSTYAYTFNGPNTMVLNNENAQESITFTRVAGQ